VGASTRSLIHTDGETMLGTKRDWLCNAYWHLWSY